MNIMHTLNEFLEFEEEMVSFGEILGHGAFSVAIDVEYPYLNDIKDELARIKDPVLIITKEEEKFLAMKKLFKNVVKIDVEEKINSARKDWLEYVGFNTKEEAEDEGYEFNECEYLNEFSLLPFFQSLNMDFNLYAFFMDKCEKYEGEETHLASLIVNDLGQFHSRADFFREFDTGYETIEDVREKREAFSWFKTPDDIDEETFLKKIFVMIKIIERDVKKIAGSFRDDAFLSLDIHSGQFLQSQGEIYCSDPFVI